MSLYLCWSILWPYANKWLLYISTWFVYFCVIRQLIKGYHLNCKWTPLTGDRIFNAKWKHTAVNEVHWMNRMTAQKIWCVFIHMVYLYYRIWLVCNFGSLFNTNAKRTLWGPILQLVSEVSKGCTEEKKVIFIYEFKLDQTWKIWP